MYAANAPSGGLNSDDFGEFLQASQKQLIEVINLLTLMSILSQPNVAN